MKQRQEIDLQLLGEAKQGNQYAYTKLFKHYRGIIQYYIFNSVYNTADAEDLTMITFEKAFSKLNMYTPTNEFQTWLSRIAKNTVIDFLVTKGRRPGNFVEVHDNHITNHHHITNPEDEYINKEIGQFLEKAINKLNNIESEILKLRYYENMEMCDIAKMLNIPENTARCRLFRARISLSERMKQKLNRKTSGKVSYFKL